MNKTALLIIAFAATFSMGFFLKPSPEKQLQESNLKSANIRLGVFSMSLSVKDLKASKSFYEKLGFTVFGGGMEQNYLIMKNENALIGLFHNMFESNILTFNPGWDENAHNIVDFDDVRTIQESLKSKGIKLLSEADEKSTGPASIMLTDPDGNLIYIDQHR
jgi:predicted lactoylglutathione lyase